MYPWAKLLCGLKLLHDHLHFVSCIAVYDHTLQWILLCCYCISLFILYFHERASVSSVSRSSVTTANVCLSLLLSRGPHAAQPALRGLQAVCGGQGSGLLSKRRRVLHHWNGGRGSQTLQVSLMAFFFFLFFLYFSSDTNASVAHWSHPAADLGVNFIHRAFHFLLLWGICKCVCRSLAQTVCFVEVGLFSRRKWSAYLFFGPGHWTRGSDTLRPRRAQLKRNVKQNTEEICLSHRFWQQSWRRADPIWRCL